jgi:hypothetical protein
MVRSSHLTRYHAAALASISPHELAYVGDAVGIREPGSVEHIPILAQDEILAVGAERLREERSVEGGRAKRRREEGITQLL